MRALLPVSVFLAAVWLLGIHPGCAQDTDPVVAFRSVVSALPKQGQIASTKSSYDISDVAFDVKKTESLVTPIVGLITYTATLPATPRGRSFSVRCRLEFAWVNNRWLFTRVLNDHTGKEFISLDGSKDYFHADPPLRAFLAPYRISPQASATP
jgi:hypothetical protein